MKRLATRAEMLHIAAFDNLRTEIKKNAVAHYLPYGGRRVFDRFLVYSPENEIVGHIDFYNHGKYGTFIGYLGYGGEDGLYDKRIPDLKKKYPNVGIDLILWARNNLKPPFHAKFMNEELANTLRAERGNMDIWFEKSDYEKVYNYAK